MSDEHPHLSTLLLGLEKELMDPIVRQDQERAQALLSADFEEFGASGRTWTRQEIVGLLASETDPPPAIDGFRCRVIAPDVALVTYRTIRTPRDGASVIANRSSIWRREEAGWRIVFHQGTPAT